MITFQNFTKYYGSHLILDIPDITIPAGIHWIKGENGSGKTTLFKALAGLLPYKGNIILRDNVLLSKKPIWHRRYVNFSEAEPLYPDFLSGMDLIHLFAKAKHAPAGQVLDLIQIFRADYLNKAIHTYSSGMQKKLSLILGFIGTPKLLLLDEPLITLDEMAIQTVYHLIQAYAHKYSTSFLISSHQELRKPSLPFTDTWLVQNQTLAQTEQIL